MSAGQSFIAAYVLIFIGYCLILLISTRVRPRAFAKVPSARPLSLGIVVPAYNELRSTGSIAAAIGIARDLAVPIVVVDDGSTDGSDVLLEDLCREDGARLLRHRLNRGKAAALNTGIAALGTDLVLTIDADTRLEAADLNDALIRFGDSRTGAVALTIDGSGTSFLTRAQFTEYRYILNFERAALARLGIVFTVPGAASVWRRDALTEIGGFRSRTCAEDTDATISLSLAGWRIEVAPNPARTDCPASIRKLLRQRARWIWGTIQAAGFALVNLAQQRSLRHVGPGVAFIAATTLNMTGFLFSIVFLTRLFFGEAGWSDLLAGGVLLNLAAFRLWLAYPAHQPAVRRLFVDLARVCVMQAVNTAAFWLGLMTGRAARISWH